MKIKKYIAMFVALLVAIIGLSMTSHEASAAKYGAKLYTTPKALRGTWHYKSGKATEGMSTKKYVHPYKKIKITKHTIIFYKKAHKSALKGKYTLYKEPSKSKFSLNKQLKIGKYAAKHKWLSVYGTRKNQFSFKQNWFWFYEESATGNLHVKGKKLTMMNASFTDTFRK